MTLEELRNLDLKDIDFKRAGDWPLAGRVFVCALVFVVVLLGGYYFVVSSQLATLSATQQKETKLKREFESKQHLAANLDAYKTQLSKMRKTFGALLRQLPSQTEIDDLLREISETAQQDGLQQILFQPKAEIMRNFYAEKPIQMQYQGNYQQIAHFVSDVSSLPRIVTLHDFKLTPASKSGGGELNFKVTAMTYRYLTEQEMAARKHKGKGGH